MRTLSRIACSIALLSLNACGGAQRGEPSASIALAPIATFEHMPSGVAVWQDRVFLSFPRWSSGEAPTVAEWVDGALVPFPSREANDRTQGAAALHSVNGLHVDRHGRLWMLDNGRVDLGPAAPGVPKLVVWDLERGDEAFRIAFDETIAPLSGSFLNDLAVDLDHGAVYMTESGIGGTPALVVHDLATGVSRRVLEGHSSVLADERLRVAGVQVTVSLGGVAGPWRIGANSLALSADSGTLFFGATSSPTAFAVPTAALRDVEMPSEWLATRVRPAASKTHSDGMALCDGRLVWASPEAGGVCQSTPLGFVCSELPGAPFTVGVECVDGGVLATTAPLHLMPLVQGGIDQRTGGNHLWMVPLSVPQADSGPSEPTSAQP